MHYFAYGSNMDHSQMRQRCPDSTYKCKAVLHGYKFVYDGYSKSRKGPVANVILSVNNNVWGGLYEISENDRDSLDQCEGFYGEDSSHNVYDRTVVSVRDDGGNNCEATVYLRDALERGVPSKEYRDVILQGAKDCSLPLDYVENCI